jgi:glutamate racemase
MIIVACGTVSSVAGDLIEDLDLPATTVLKPTARAAAAATKTGRVGVIATTATIHSGSYRRELAAINPKIEVFERDCPLFVPLVENGFVDENDEVTRMVAERYLVSLREQKVDTLIMGCTHYPIISKIISRVMGDGVTLIDSGREAALYAQQILDQQGLLCDKTQESSSTYFVSDTVEGFSQVADIFLGQNVNQNVQHVDIG